MKDFKRYLIYGVLSVLLGRGGDFCFKIAQHYRKSLYEDVAIMGDIKKSKIAVLKKILWLIASASPFTVNIDKISRDLGYLKITFMPISSILKELV